MAEFKEVVKRIKEICDNYEYNNDSSPGCAKCPFGMEDCCPYADIFLDKAELLEKIALEHQCVDWASVQTGTPIFVKESNGLWNKCIFVAYNNNNVIYTYNENICNLTHEKGYCYSVPADANIRIKKPL